MYVYLCVKPVHEWPWRPPARPPCETMRRQSRVRSVSMQPVSYASPTAGARAAACVVRMTGTARLAAATARAAHFFCRSRRIANRGERARAKEREKLRDGRKGRDGAGGRNVVPCAFRSPYNTPAHRPPPAVPSQSQTTRSPPNRQPSPVSSTRPVHAVGSSLTRVFPPPATLTTSWPHQPTVDRSTTRWRARISTSTR